MKNIFFNFIIAASTTLFALPSHLSAQPTDELRANNASNSNVEAQTAFKDFYANGTFTSSISTIIYPINSTPSNGIFAIPFNNVGEHTRNISLYNDTSITSAPIAVIVKKSGRYSANFGVSAVGYSNGAPDENVGTTFTLTVGGCPTGCFLPIPPTYSKNSPSLITAGTLIDICVEENHDCCPFTRGVLVKLVNNGANAVYLTSSNDSTNTPPTTNGITAFLTLFRIGDANCDND